MIPNGVEPIAGTAVPSRAYRQWFEELARLVASAGSGDASNTAQLIADLTSRFDNAIIQGLSSVSSTGTLANGQIYIQLVGDESPVPSSSYYGTDSAGTQGYFSLPSGTTNRIDQSGNVRKTSDGNLRIITE